MTRFFLQHALKKTYFNIKFCACTSCISQLLLFKHSVYPVLHDAQTLHVCNKKHLVKSNTERNRNCFNVNSSGLLLLTCLILYQILKSQFKTVCFRDKIVSLTTTQMHVITDVHKIYFFEAIIIIIHKSYFIMYIPSYLLQSQ